MYGIFRGIALPRVNEDEPATSSSAVLFFERRTQRLGSLLPTEQFHERRIFLSICGGIGVIIEQTLRSSRLVLTTLFIVRWLSSRVWHG